MTHMIQVPVAKLSLSKENVRRRNREVGLDALAADIAAHGLLQNLVVEPLKKAGTYTVKAGGRRLRALQQLIEQGQLPADHTVNVLVLGEGPEAGEASLAENFQRLPMNPADECTAFSAIVARGATADDVAQRFGLTTRFVEGRLRLAELAKPVFEALAAGEITLGAAQAYAVVPDTDRQARVFENSRGYYANNVDQIRRQMLQGTAHATDAIVRCVGRDAYLAAGGRIEADLFGDADDETYVDVELLETLARAKLDAAAAELAATEGFGFVRPVLGTHVPYDAQEELHRFHAPRVPLTADAQTELDTLTAESDALQASLESEQIDEAEADAAEARLEAVERERQAVMDRSTAIDADIRAKLGTFVYLGNDGAIRVYPALFSEQRLTPAGEPLTRPDIDAKAASGESISQALVDELATQRRQILAAAIASNPSMALDLAVFLMADKRPVYSSVHGSTLSAKEAGTVIPTFKDEGSRATEALQDRRYALDFAWTREDRVCDRFDAFRSIDDDAKADWLAYTVAQTLEASANSPLRSHTLHDHLGRLLEIDVAASWRPTAANYFGRVKKEKCLAALEEIGGPTLSGRYKAAKKGEIAATCEALCAGRGIIEAELRERALAYVPDAMRFDAVEPATRSPGEVDRDQLNVEGDESGFEAANDEEETGLSQAA